jgi:hypothetical protein
MDEAIFQRLEDCYDWDKLIQHSQTLEGFTPFEKEKCKRAFRFLREELGEEFLKVAFTEGHSICNYITNLAPWTRRWIIWFAEALKELKGQENYSSLLKRIKDRSKFEEGILILGLSFRFLKADFKITIDPIAEVSEGRKTPDLKIIDVDTGGGAFCRNFSYSSK